MSVTSGQQVLLAEGNRKRVLRKTIVVVNSRDRQILAYPSTSLFRFVLRRPLKEIHSIELVNGAIPGLIYTINSGWNTFTFQEDLEVYTVTMTPGLYDASSLAKELEDRLNAMSLANTYTCSVDPNTQRLTLAATGGKLFGLLFYSGTPHDEFDMNGVHVLQINTPGRFLGFGFNDYMSDATGKIVSPVAMDAENFLNRLYLYINAESTTELHRMEVGAGGRDCFHIFFASPGSANYIFLNKETETPMFVASPAPLARLSFLDISIRDEFYRPIDLQNRDVNLVFEIAHFE